MSYLNIEIKARCASPDAIRTILRSLNADFRGIDHQVDTYFNVQWGRLKLREGNIENALVYYEREDLAEPKQSIVTLYPTPQSSALKAILTQILGILTIVDKQREIYFIENVKFHLDTVMQLGTFVEIEAIDRDGILGKEKLRAQCQRFLALFRIVPADLIAVSYSDLLFQQPTR
ncbi:MAG: class IV adenylate cyclase [Candidatus Binatia bacterium]